jgi:Protein of unknown function (DUF3761)
MAGKASPIVGVATLWSEDDGMKRLGAILLGLILAIGALGCDGGSQKTNQASSGTPTGAVPSAPVQHHTVRQIHYTACDKNISVGPHTTCGFADNVFRAFAREAAQGAEEASVTATSPTTRKAYAVRCRTTHEVTLCTGGIDARIRFPLWAAKVYSPSTSPERESPSPSPEPEGPESSPGAEKCTNGTYENSSGNIVCRPEESPTAPAGATAQCADGTYSFSEHRSGTCSHHGGVAEWLSG